MLIHANMLKDLEQTITEVPLHKVTYNRLDIGFLCDCSQMQI